MNPISIQFVASTFTVLGWVIGVPSLIGLLTFAAHRVRSLFTPAASGPNFGSNPDAILLMLKGISEVFGGLDRLAGSVGHFLLKGIAILAGIGLVLAVSFWLTGRGLHARDGWARVSAFILLTLAILPSLLLGLSMHNVGRIVPVLIAIACTLALHAVWANHPSPLVNR